MLTGLTAVPVTRLNAIRDEQAEQQTAMANNAPSSSTAPNGIGPAPAEPNRVDTILADVFALLSLFFLTIGKSRETPATYCQIVATRVGFPTVALQNSVHR